MNQFPRINRLPPYTFSLIAEMRNQLRADGHDVIDCSMGNPDQPTPAHIVNKLITSATEPPNHRYSVSRGITPLREAICNWYARKFQVQLDPDTEALVTIGSKEGLAHLALATTHAGDTIITPDPAYPIHPYGFIIADAQVISIPLHPVSEFLKRLEQCLAQTHPRPKMLVLNFPANPSGDCVDLDFFKQLMQIVQRYPLWVVHDIAYGELCFDGYQAPSILQIPGAKQYAAEVYSLSKTYNMAGWRVGFLCGNPELVAALTRIKSYLDYGTFAPIQHAAITALEGPQDCVQNLCELYQERRDVLCQGLNQIGWPVAPPKATMFVWAKMPATCQHMPALDFAKRLLQEAHIAVSPGSGFGPAGEGYIRFSLIESSARLEQAIDRLARFFKDCS